MAGGLSVLSALDHLVIAARDLDEGVRRIEALLGTRAVRGGRHDGRGTRNALFGLGQEAYLEVIAPDPDQPDPPGGRWLGVDAVDGPSLVTWAARPVSGAPGGGGIAAGGGARLEAVRERARTTGVDLGEVIAASRRRPDGSLLSWSFTDPRADRAGGVIPFFIDWGSAMHPARTLPAGCVCVALEAEHPEAERIGAALAALGLPLPVTHGPAPRLVARIETAAGVVELGT